LLRWVHDLSTTGYALVGEYQVAAEDATEVVAWHRIPCVVDLDMSGCLVAIEVVFPAGGLRAGEDLARLQRPGGLSGCSYDPEADAWTLDVASGSKPIQRTGEMRIGRNGDGQVVRLEVTWS
jgi:uncharacterized protein YuzE